jgi:hypothetical protein
MFMVGKTVFALNGMKLNTLDMTSALDVERTENEPRNNKISDSRGV